jgi:hypothetical protein
MKLLEKSFAIFLLVSACCAQATWGQSSSSFKPFLYSDPLLLSCPGVNQRKQDNEFAYSGEATGTFYCNPLVLDGMLFDYNAITLESNGELTLIKGDPKNSKVLEIPFYLHLRRNGKILTHPNAEGVFFSKAEISTILEIAQNGDELIVEPVNKEDWPAKRIIKIGGGC